ncbi:MAG: hypothetical protein POH28_12745, partial [Acidocella sp.]|nr:hypothetical protein [Acidocella sp.]
LGGSKWAGFYAGPPSGPSVPRHLATHEQVLCHPDGRITIALDSTNFEARRIILLATGVGIPLGRFLSGGVAASLSLMPGHEAIPAGGALTPVQAEMLERLGLADTYLTITQPTGFARVLQSAPDVIGDAAYATIIARLRRPMVPHPPATIAILPNQARARFSLRNQRSLTIWLRARQILVLNPDAAVLDETIAGLSRASRVIIADLAQAGVLGFCRPGTQILEIAPEGWAEQQIRMACRALDLEWQLCLAPAPSYAPLNAPPLGCTQALGYDIPIAALARALAVL